MTKLSLIIALFVCTFISSINIANAQGYGMQHRGGTSQGLGPADANYDLRYIDRMIRHHQNAVTMSEDAVKKAQHPELKQFAQNIINTQSKEITQMETWRKQWYGK
jgi:uncharacterized protein (DUF305 family)